MVLLIMFVSVGGYFKQVYLISCSKRGVQQQNKTMSNSHIDKVNMWSKTTLVLICTMCQVKKIKTTILNLWRQVFISLY